jgi:signal transduction histidine kinase
VQLAPTNVVPILDHSLRVARETGFEVHFAPTDVPLVMADADRIAEVFDELIMNALQCVKNEIPVLRASVCVKDAEPESNLAQGSYAVVTLIDNGAGIPPAKKEAIFLPFSTTRAHGTGLGLSLAQRVLEVHGGMLRENGLDGDGARFEVWIPLADGGAP